MKIETRGKQFKDRERRYVEGVEFRQETEDEMVLVGYALKFNNETLIGTEDFGYREIILKDALEETDLRVVPMKYNHDGGYLAIASTKNGSLKLTVDEIGLRFEAHLIDTQANRDVFTMVQEGLLSECSFAFILDMEKGSEWEDLEEDIPLRKIKKIKRLYDVALVDIPAYDNTEVYARGLEALEDAKATVETEKEEQRKKEREKIERRTRIKLKLGGIEK